jgi:hypothetical protein
MDRVISLLAALVGLIALGGAILVHTNADTQRTQMAAEIAQLKLSVGLITQQRSGTTEVADATPLPTAKQASIPSAEMPPPSSSSVAVEASSSSAEPSIASAEPIAPLLPPSPPYVASPSELAASSSSDLASSSSSSAAPADDASTQLKTLQDRIAQLEQTTKDQASALDAAHAQLASAPPTQVASANASSQGPAPAAIVADGPTKDCIPLGTRFMGQSGDSFPICKTKLVVKVAAVADGVTTIGGAGDIATGAFGTLAKGCNVMVFSSDPSGFAEMRVTCQ